MRFAAIRSVTFVVVVASALLASGRSFAGTTQITDCRIYVESAVDQPIQDWEQITFFLRTRNGFDSSIASVILEGQMGWADFESGQQTLEPYSQAVNLVSGYQDLWQITVPVSADEDVGDITDTRILGSFVVTTASGATYTLQAKDPASGNWAPFTLDPNMYGNLEKAMSSKGLGLQEAPPSSLNALAVHGNFPYLDPNGCETPTGTSGAPNFR